MSHIFISYSIQNSEYANELANKLREEGFNIWIDNEALRTSEVWWEAIVKAIGSCTAFVVIMTPEARASRWVQREILLAEKLLKPAFPILLAGDNWEFYIATQYENVKPSKFPSAKFYDKLEEFSHRQRHHGENVVHQRLEILPEQDDEISQEIANPPPISETALPLIEAEAEVVAHIDVQDTFVLSEQPPPQPLPSSIPLAKPDRKPVGSTTSGKKLPLTSPKRPTTSHRKRTLFLLVMFLLIIVSGTYIIFSGILARPNATNDLPTLIVLPTTSGSCQELAQTPPANTNQIAFASYRDGNYEIYLMNDDGSDLCRLTENTSSDLSPTWSPDGRKIAFTSNRDGSFQIYLMNADGSNQYNLTKNSSDNRDPTWSPDGRQIAFASKQDGSFEIYLMNVDGSNLHKLTDSIFDNLAPAWSPDASKIAFQSNRRGDWEIYMMNADGRNPRNLTNNSGADYWPTWSPDGQQIAFYSNRYEEREIYVMNVDDRNLRNLTTSTAIEQHPDWSQDGRQIVFNAYLDGSYKIFVVNADGSEPHNITNTRANDYSPAWRPVPKS